MNHIYSLRFLSVVVFAAPGTVWPLTLTFILCSKIPKFKFFLEAVIVSVAFSSGVSDVFLTLYLSELIPAMDTKVYVIS